MREKYTGGPASPLSPHSGEPCDDGMSLRDYYAAHAPIGCKDLLDMMGTPDDLTLEQIFDEWAVLRLAYADAMLTARDR